MTPGASPSQAIPPLDPATCGLEDLVAHEHQIVLGQETVQISPLRVGQLPAFLRAIAPVAQQLSRGEIDWIALLAEHGDNVLQAVAVAASKPRSWVDALPTDHALRLAAKVIEVNADFFTRAVIPNLAALTPPSPMTGQGAARAAVQSAGGGTSGPTPSSA